MNGVLFPDSVCFFVQDFRSLVPYFCEQPIQKGFMSFQHMRLELRNTNHRIHVWYLFLHLPYILSHMQVDIPYMGHMGSDCWHH